MPDEREIAEAFPVGHLIQEELEARGWTTIQLAIRMGGTAREILINQLATDMLIAVPEAGIDQAMAEDYARAFDVSPELFINFDRCYKEWKKRKTDAERAGRTPESRSLRKRTRGHAVLRKRR